MSADHTVTIKHDPESHEFDCHDDCTASVACPGVTDSCRCWLECATCREARNDLDDDALIDYDERLYEEEVAHGVEHQHIDGMWMTPTDQCLTAHCDHDANELIDTLPDGVHPVEINCEDGFVYINALEVQP